ncbi:MULTISPECIES: CBO0543 family protein [Bacillaceae]|uniref:CBO0543 family protein n=1 Tax=Bacillaceae TaxID=186817 RepID=UPI002FFF412C
MESFKKIEQTYEELRTMWLDYWFEEVFLTYQWWIEVVIVILSLFLFWKFIDQSRLREISLVGFITAGIAFILDQIGTSLGLWIYPYTLTPLERDEFAPADLSIVPLFYVMIYQKFSTWKNYIIAIMIYAFIASFIGESFFQMLGIYKVINWNHIYSVPFYILIGIFVKMVLQRLNSIEFYYKGKK